MGLDDTVNYTITPKPRARIFPLRSILIQVLLALLCLPGFAVVAARAGVLHEDLVGQLNRAAPGETVSGLITLNDQLDLPRLEQEMSARGIHTRWRRHEYVIRAAQSFAQRTQGELLSEIRDLSARGEVASVEPFWITNAIAISAKPSAFLALSLRNDVGMIYANAPVSLRGEVEAADPEEQDAGAVTPKSQLPGPRDQATLQDGLIAINVQPAWDLGFAGADRLVCDIDTGADGSHPAYATRWRGAQPGIPWQQAWYDPYGGTQFPYDGQSHGTHTLGIMVAHPPASDPLGVAPDAQWIAAGALLGWDVIKIIGCMEWAADPDGDPSTIADVPDVANNSWGTSDDCSSTFWGAIDLLEAAGVVNVIAVDNTGPAPASVNSPESRAVNSLVNFGVGNLDPHTPGYPIASSSGRGPSPCDYSSIKPNMTAPGTSILSSIPGGGYGLKSGCSMAAPHVSGACAILRQVNPSLTVSQIKQILMDTAVDLGTSGPDNNYGWGLLNVGSAVNYVMINLPPSPSPRNLIGTAFPDSGVDLRWLRPNGILDTNPLTGYNIYRAVDQEPYPPTPRAAVGPLTTTYFDPNLTLGSYRYVVTATYQNGNESEPSNEVLVNVVDPTAVNNAVAGSSLPILSVRPNPFESGTTIELVSKDQAPRQEEFSGASTGATSGFGIFDASGRRVRTLQNEGGKTGQRAFWDGRDDQGQALPSGVYFARTQGMAGAITQPLVLTR